MLREDSIWPKCGRKPSTTASAINERVKSKKARNGKSLGGSEVEEIILELSKEEYLKRGGLEAQWDDKRISQKSLNRFAKWLRSSPNMNVFANANSKTETRGTAEWSIRSTIAFVMAVASSHFISEEHRSEYHPDISTCDYDDLPAGAKAMKDLVEEMRGERVIPILPKLVTSTDATSIYCTPETLNKPEDWFITNKPDPDADQKATSSGRSNYTNKSQGDRHTRGVRIEINNTFTAGGQSATIFIVVSGLTREEVPGEKDIEIIEMPGLTPNGHQFM